MKNNLRKLLTLSLVFLLFSMLSACTTNDEVSETAPVQEAAITITQKKGGKRIYFAAPLFSAAERDYNLYIVNILESYGYEVFLPQRDGFLATELVGLSEEEKTKKIFAKDCEEVLKSDILFFMLDGRVPDEGGCFELGLAYANGLRCYGLKNDPRVVESDMELNPMITGALIKLFCNYDSEELIKELKAYLDANEL